MNNIKRIAAVIGATLVLATASVPAFADDITYVDDPTSTTVETTVEESTTKEEESVSEANNVFVETEDVTLETTEPEEKIDFVTEDISIVTPTDADISIEYAPIDEEIPNTGSNNVVAVVGSACALALSALAILIVDKKKTA